MMAKVLSGTYLALEMHPRVTDPCDQIATIDGRRMVIASESFGFGGVQVLIKRVLP